MSATRRLQEGVFELLDQLTLFVHDHALGFLLAIIVLTVVGGLWLLIVLRRHGKSRTLESRGETTVGCGLLIAPRPQPPPPEPLPPADPRDPPWDDLRD